jgi:hypothetical protein
MYMDLVWGEPASLPITEHSYAEGSAWRSQHPEVYYRLRMPTSPGEVSWVYWCPRTKKEGLLTYMKRKGKGSKMKESWLVGEYPYDDTSWWCCREEADAIQLACSIVLNDVQDLQ